MGCRNRNNALNIKFCRAFPTSQGFPSSLCQNYFFRIIYMKGHTQNNFASKNMHITSSQLHLHYISGNGYEWLASAMTHYSFLGGLGISARGEKPHSISYCFFWQADTPWAILLEEAAGEWKKKVKPGSPRKGHISAAIELLQRKWLSSKGLQMTTFIQLVLIEVRQLVTTLDSNCRCNGSTSGEWQREGDKGDDYTD